MISPWKKPDASELGNLEIWKSDGYERGTQSWYFAVAVQRSVLRCQRSFLASMQVNVQLKPIGRFVQALSRNLKMESASLDKE